MVWHQERAWETKTIGKEYAFYRLGTVVCG